MSGDISISSSSTPSSVNFASVDNIDRSAPQMISSTAGPTLYKTTLWTQHTATSGDSDGAFPDMDVDLDLDRVSCVETLCLHCNDMGLTRLLLTKIPYFREIVIMSFECPHCNARNSEVQPANELASKACKITLNVDCSDNTATRSDLNRQVIKSGTCKILIPELEFEIPPNNRRGDIDTDLKVS